MQRQINTRISEDLLNQLNKDRDLISKSVYIRRLIENELNTVNNKIRQDSTIVYGMTQNHQDGGAVNV